MREFKDVEKRHLAEILVKRILHYIVNRLEDDELLDLSITRFKDWFPEIADEVGVWKKTKEDSGKKILEYKSRSGDWTLEYNEERLAIQTKFFTALLTCDKVEHMANALTVFLCLCNEEGELTALMTILNDLSHRTVEENKRKMALH